MNVSGTAWDKIISFLRCCLENGQFTTSRFYNMWMMILRGCFMGDNSLWPSNFGILHNFQILWLTTPKLSNRNNHTPSGLLISISFYFDIHPAPSRDTEFRPRLYSLDDHLVGRKYRSTTQTVGNFPGK